MDSSFLSDHSFTTRRRTASGDKHRLRLKKKKIQLKKKSWKKQSISSHLSSGSRLFSKHFSQSCRFQNDVHFNGYIYIFTWGWKGKKEEDMTGHITVRRKRFSCFSHHSIFRPSDVFFSLLLFLRYILFFAKRESAFSTAFHICFCLSLSPSLSLFPSLKQSRGRRGFATGKVTEWWWGLHHSGDKWEEENCWCWSWKTRKKEGLGVSLPLFFFWSSQASCILIFQLQRHEKEKHRKRETGSWKQLTDSSCNIERRIQLLRSRISGISCGTENDSEFTEGKHFSRSTVFTKLFSRVKSVFQSIGQRDTISQSIFSLPSMLSLCLLHSFHSRKWLFEIRGFDQRKTSETEISR